MPWNTIYLFLPWLFRANLQWLHFSAALGSLLLSWMLELSSDTQYPCQDLVELWAQFSVFDNRLLIFRDSNQEPVAVISCFGIIEVLQGKWSFSEVPRSCFHLVHLLLIWKGELVHHWISAVVTESSKPVGVWYLLIISNIACKEGIFKSHRFIL